MEKIILLLIIAYLIFCFFKFKKKGAASLQENFGSGENKKEKEQEKKTEMKETMNLEKHVIAAVVAVMMEGKKYRIKSVFAGDIEEKKSPWKIAGRQDSMLSGLLFRKK